jgi:hypothetical protein
LECVPANGGDPNHPRFARVRSSALQESEQDQIADLQSANVLAQLDIMDARLAPHILDVLDLYRVSHAWYLSTFK